MMASDKSAEKSDPSTMPQQSFDDAIPGQSFKPDWRFYVAFLSLSTVTLAAAFDATSISVALPIITQELRGSAIDGFWVGSSFLIATAVLQPVWVIFSHAIGRRNALLLAMALFVVGAIVCATAHFFTQMFVGRVIQGSGGAGIWVLGEVVITDLAPLRERPKWVNFITAAWALGSVSGPLLGGAFAHPNVWRWIFWINLPITAVSFVLAACFLELQSREASVWSRLAEIDYVGTFLFTAGLTAFLVPLSWGGIEFPWSSWHTVVPLVLGLLGLGLFALYGWLRKGNTFIPAQIFSNRSVFLAYFAIFVQGIFLFGILYYLPLYYEGAKQYSPVIAGVAMFPETFTVIPAAMVVGGISSKRGSYRWANWSGWALATLGAGLLWLLDWDASIPKWIFINLVAGLGLGMLYPGTVIAVMASCPQEHVAIAAGMSSFFRTAGQSVGVVVGGPIFQNRLRTILRESGPPISQFSVEYSSAATVLVDIIKGTPSGETKDLLSAAYADALKPLWATMCGLAGIALFSSLFLKGYTMDQPLKTDQGLVHEDGGKSENGA